MENEPPDADPYEGDDPFEGLVFDDDFVRSAAIVEDSADQRDRAARQANLQRLLSDRAADEANEEHARRRFAPEDDDGFAFDSDELPPRRSSRVVVAVVVVLAILVVYVLSNFVTGRAGQTEDAAPDPQATGVDASNGSPPGADGGSATVAGFVRPANWPSISDEARPTPIGVPGAVPAGGGAHSFIQLQPDGVRPVGYDPCRPIHYVTRSDGAPAGAAKLLSDAVSSVSAATGLSFIDDGVTDEAPSDDRPAFQPDRYGDRWAPVLITWSDPVESPALSAEDADPSDGSTADVLGYAGSSSVGLSDPNTSATGDQVFVTGAVTLDGPDFAEMLDEFDGYARARSVVLHELGHLVGLDHVADRSQLMAPAARPEQTEFGPGDLQGLAILGTRACFPQV